SYPWPVSSFPGPHPITGSFGEFREPYGNLGSHFHFGVDIGRKDGIQVYPVSTEKVRRWRNVENGWIQLENFRYVHINPEDLILDTTRVCTTSVTLLGVIGNITDPHLHFEEGIGISNKLNPLRDGGLNNYTDTDTPTVWGGNDFMFYKQGTNDQISSSLWGKVDILVRAKDAQSNGSNTVGVYRIGYKVNDLNGNIILPYTENIRFDNVIGHLGYIYDVNRSNNSTYYYWVTNALGNQNHNRYWNTKLKTNQSWNGQDARINQEAQYPDGRYRVEVTAYDIETNAGSRYEDVLLDNFVPFVSQVIVEREGEVIYSGNWVLSGNGMTLNKSAKNIFPGDSLNFEIAFSEVMDTTQISVKLKKSSNEWDVNSDGWISTTLWKGRTMIPVEDLVEEEAWIRIFCQDLAGNALDMDPLTIATRGRDM
ncbi:hypothetical protein KAW48_09220, partial [candidate division WOR-3 bacterium]|nr:hypothetical protein [candidate division WOR-3 bacterium]